MGMFADEALLWFGVWASISAFWAWVFLAGISAIMIGGVLYEEFAPAGLFFAVLVVFAHLTGLVDVISLASNPLVLLLYIVPYLILGLAFCFFKYRFWLRKRITEDVEEYTTATIEAIAERYKPSRMIDRITIWVIWWPICLLRIMLGDWIQALVRYIVTDILGKFFRSIWKGELERIKQNKEAGE